MELTVRREAHTPKKDSLYATSLLHAGACRRRLIADTIGRVLFGGDPRPSDQACQCRFYVPTHLGVGGELATVVIFQSPEIDE